MHDRRGPGIAAGVHRQVDLLADVNQEITARGEPEVVAKACIDLIDAGSTSQLAQVRSPQSQKLS